MKGKRSRDDRRIGELMGKLLGYELSRLPDEEALQGTYWLSDVFYHKMNRLIQDQADAFGHFGKKMKKNEKKR